MTIKNVVPWLSLNATFNFWHFLLPLFTFIHSFILHSGITVLGPGNTTKKERSPHLHGTYWLGRRFSSIPSPTRITPCSKNCRCRAPSPKSLASWCGMGSSSGDSFWSSPGDSSVQPGLWNTNLRQRSQPKVLHSWVFDNIWRHARDAAQHAAIHGTARHRQRMTWPQWQQYRNGGTPVYGNTDIRWMITIDSDGCYK